MVQNFRSTAQWFSLTIIGSCLILLNVFVSPVHGFNKIPNPEPKPGSFGLEATKTQPPPTRGATITTPGDGSSFTESPITVNGICPNELLVQIYNNGVMVGAVMCVGGSFSVEVGLFSGTNELSAIVFDDLGQAGPVSNIVSVRYTNTNFTDFGELITLTSSFGRRSAAADSQLSWPLQLSGGTGPYAFSIDWGDGTPSELKSQASSGVVNISHIYKRAGIYQANITVTDVNGVSAFLQVVALANGEIDQDLLTDRTAEGADMEPRTLWVPAAVAVGLLLPAFWLGRRSQIVSLRNKMLKERDVFSAKK